MLEFVLAFQLWGKAETDDGRLSLSDLERTNYSELSPWIADYFHENPQLKTAEVFVHRFFQQNPPDALMRDMRKSAPTFYKMLERSEFGDLPASRQEAIQVKDLLRLPGPELAFLVQRAAVPLHQMLVSNAGPSLIDAYFDPADAAGRKVAHLLLREARQTTAQEFSRQALVAIGLMKAAERW